MWILPTQGNISGLSRFFEAVLQVRCSTPGAVLVNKAEYAANRGEYDKIKKSMPFGWDYRPTDATTSAEMVREVTPTLLSLPWVGGLTDNMVPASANWDQMISAAVRGYNIITCPDSASDVARLGCMAWSGDVLRAFGYLIPPGVDEVYAEDWWDYVGRESSVLTNVSGAVMRVEPSRPATGKWFGELVAKNGKAAVATLDGILAKRGLKVLRPNFAGKRLMIATPTHSGSPDSLFLKSINDTLKFVAGQGVDVCWVQEPFNADISLARARLFSTFMRSDYTHCLMIDDDMGWSTDAIVRVFAADRDLVGVAGPKKMYPLTFAANRRNPDGSPAPIAVDPEIGAAEVDEVGFAFMMLSKNCGNKLIGAFPELEFTDAGGVTCWNPFIPMIIDKGYRPEDYAFCQRFRKIGGKVFICPDVAISHVGRHVYHGDLISASVAQGNVA